MMFKKTVLAAAAVSVLAFAGISTASAADRDRDGRPDNSWAERHDRDSFHDRAPLHNRYWKPGSGRYVAHDRVFSELRRHHYTRWSGKPYFYRGHYVVRSYRGNRPVFVEINPYTGFYIGEIRL